MSGTDLRKKKDTTYIVGLKGLACFMIMVGHYLSVYQSAESFSVNFRAIDFLYNSPVSFFLGGSFWIYLFFAISGFLLSKENLTTLLDTVIKCVHRFVRLALPVLFSYLLVYFLLLIIGSHNAETVGLFENEWYQHYYQEGYSLMDVIRGPIDVLLFGRANLIAPYWVLRDMFFASLIIYILSYLKNKLYMSDGLYFLIGVVIMAAVSFKKPIITACLAGTLLGFCERRDASFFRSATFGLGMILAVLFFYRTSKEILSTMFFLSVILFLPQITVLNALFKSGFMKFLGRISWAVYSFHWPLMCSVGAILLLQISGIKKAYTLAFLTCVILTVLVSCLYDLSFAKLEKRIAGWIDQGLMNLKQLLTKAP